MDSKELASTIEKLKQMLESSTESKSETKEPEPPASAASEQKAPPTAPAATAPPEEVKQEDEKKASPSAFDPFVLFKADQTQASVETIQKAATDGDGNAHMFLYLLHRDGFKQLDYGKDAKKADLHLEQAFKKDIPTAVIVTAEKALAQPSKNDKEGADVLRTIETPLLTLTEHKSHRRDALFLLGIAYNRAGRQTQCEAMLVASATEGHAKALLNLLNIRFARMQGICAQTKDLVSFFLSPPNKKVQSTSEATK